MSNTQSAHVCTSTTSAVLLPALTGLTHIGSALDDALVFIADQGAGSLVVTRHLSASETKWCPERAGAWTGIERRRDASGTEFSREIRLVEDNYGELVEVPTC